MLVGNEWLLADDTAVMLGTEQWDDIDSALFADDGELADIDTLLFGAGELHSELHSELQPQLHVCDITCGIMTSLHSQLHA